MYWANLLHIYQPSWQKKDILNKVISESYDKILSILESNPKIKISLNICASLTEQLVKHGYIGIIQRIKKLAEKSQIELIGSAKYHPILPFLPKSEMIRQIKLNENLNQKYFGKVWRPRPKGFFLPELAYNKKIARIVQSLGYQWIVLDEIAYNGKFGQVCFNKNYEIKDLFPGQGDKKKIKIIFRNRDLSTLFFGDWLDSVDKFFSSIDKDKRSSEFLVTAFDGENLGHHEKRLPDLWVKILNRKDIKAVTYSEYLSLLKNKSLEKIDPLPSSWSTEIKDFKNNIPYPLWNSPKNQLHQLQWQLTNLILKMVGQGQNNVNYGKARELLDKDLGSDQYWWACQRPWWGPEIVKESAERFIKISGLLKSSVSPAIQKRAKDLVQKIFKQVEIRNQLNNRKPY